MLNTRARILTVPRWFFAGPDLLNHGMVAVVRGERRRRAVDNLVERRDIRPNGERENLELRDRERVDRLPRSCIVNATVAPPSANVLLSNIAFISEPMWLCVAASIANGMAVTLRVRLVIV